MKNMFNNLSNGNLQDAKRQAKKYSFCAIQREAESFFPCDKSVSYKIASYLKGLITFEKYCE